jgi:preprotein translocase subunit SecF
MRIIGETHIPFLSYRKVALGLSAVLLVTGIALIATGISDPERGYGLNFGIDFAGGTQVIVKFREQPDLRRLRSTLAGLESGTPVIQRFDEAEKNEIIIRVENPEGAEGDFTKPIIDLLHTDYNVESADLFDLNTQGSQALTDLLAAVDPDLIGGDDEAKALHYGPMADAVLSYRKNEGQGIFAAVDELERVEGLSDGARSALAERATVGAFSLLAAESVGPAVGADLQKQASLAIGLSLLGMLIYIWIRFQLPYGVGAAAALFHDVLITLTALALTGREINLPTIAALLTLVGYSVNDTVVVFDRVRENLRLRRGEDLESLMNDSINQVLSRTFITSGTTLIVVLSLYIFGGDVINTFAFVLLIGILVGTYSSIFVAAPVALAVNKLLVARRERRRSRGRR